VNSEERSNYFSIQTGLIGPKEVKQKRGERLLIGKTGNRGKKKVSRVPAAGAFPLSGPAFQWERPGQKGGRKGEGGGREENDERVIDYLNLSGAAGRENQKRNCGPWELE